jgi:hypothetical protein
MLFSPAAIPESADASPLGEMTADELAEAARLQQYEIIWVLPVQYPLSSDPDGFGLEIRDFLGPGDLDQRGKCTVWVRGPIASSGLHRGQVVTVAVPHDQPRARRSGGAVLRPEIPGPFEHQVPQQAGSNSADG